MKYFLCLLLLLVAACGSAPNTSELAASNDQLTMVATATVVDPSCKTNLWCSAYNANGITECEQAAPAACSYFCNQSTGCGPTARSSLGREDFRPKKLEGFDAGEICTEAYTTCNIIDAPRGSRWIVFNFECECVW